MVVAAVLVIPAKAGIHLSAPETVEEWIPAFGGMTYYGADANRNPKAPRWLGALSRSRWVMLRCNKFWVNMNALKLGISAK
jgi:hypothetical protein